MTPVDLLLLTLLGGVVALDTTSVGQFMLSRPLAAGVLAGWIVGDPALGLLLGGVLEVLHIMIFPIGGGRFPEPGPATVVAVAAATAVEVGPGGALMAGTLAGVVWSHLGGASVELQRRLNDRIATDPYSEALSPGQVVRHHLAAIGLDFVRGVVLTLSGLLAGLLAGPLLARAWPLDVSTTLALFLVAAAVPLGILLRSFGGFRKRAVLFASGLLAGVMGAVLL